MTRAYLDHNAAAPLRPEARRAIHEAVDRAAANPSSAHAAGRGWRAHIDRARRAVARLIGSRPHEICFTGSGSESCALALLGAVRAGRSRGRHVVASTIEHSAVREPLLRLADRGEIDLEWLPVGLSGRVRPEALLGAVRPDTALAVLMWANNETGVVQPVEEVATELRERGVAFFVDAVAWAGRGSIDLKRTPIDLLAISAHKIGGPSGTGALYVREGMPLDPPAAGGGQEMGLRGGTENLIGIAGFEAAALATVDQWVTEADVVRRLRDRLVAGVRARLPEVRLAGEESPRLCNTAQLLVPAGDEEMLILALDRRGYAVSAGSACAAGAHRRSHVLQAMGLLAPGLASIRVSLGAGNNEAEVDGFVEALAQCLTADSGPAAADQSRAPADTGGTGSGRGPGGGR